MDRDPAAGNLDADRPGEGQLCMLRGAVGARVTCRDRPRNRGDVDEVGGSAGFERGHERPQAPDRAEIVDADKLLDLLRLEVEEAAAVTCDAGVVDE